MMQYKNYIGRVEFDAEAGILHGEVVGIRDVVTFQGKSVEEVEQAFKDSVDDYLAFCRQRAEEPDKPCSGTFVVRIGSELHRQADMLAKASGKSLNAWLTQCVNRQVAQECDRLGSWRQARVKNKRARSRTRSPRRRAGK